MDGKALSAPPISFFSPFSFLLPFLFSLLSLSLRPRSTPRWWEKSQLISPYLSFLSLSLLFLSFSFNFAVEGGGGVKGHLPPPDPQHVGGKTATDILPSFLSFPLSPLFPFFFPFSSFSLSFCWGGGGGTTAWEAKPFRPPISFFLFVSSFSFPYFSFLPSFSLFLSL